MSDPVFTTVVLTTDEIELLVAAVQDARDLEPFSRKTVHDKLWTALKDAASREDIDLSPRTPAKRRQVAVR
jgi:hypothetical protein